MTGGWFDTPGEWRQIADFPRQGATADHDLDGALLYFAGDALRPVSSTELVVGDGRSL